MSPVSLHVLAILASYGLFALAFGCAALASFGTWGLYVVYLGTRIGLGWRGVRPQYLLLVGLVVAIALYAIPSATHRFNTLSSVSAPPTYSR